MARKPPAPKISIETRPGRGKNATPTANATGDESLPTAQDVSFKNGLAEAVGYQSIGGFPGSGASESVSQSTPMFNNLRWYLISNFRQLLSQAYVELGLVQTVIDVPVEDALRGGIEIKSNQLNEQQLQELMVAIDRDDDLGTVGTAAKWNRLYGGAGIIVINDQDPEEPLDLDSIKKGDDVEFRAVDMWELFWSEQLSEGNELKLGANDFEHYDYYGEKLHKSRVLTMKGLTAPSFVRSRLRGWGFSVVEVLVRSINQYMKATNLSYEVLDEFKLDIYMIKNLVNTLASPLGQQKVHERVRLANWQKNYQNAVVLDSEDKYESKQLSFAGLGEAMQGIRTQVASDMRFPVLKLFGTPAQGLGATDEDSIEVYNSMVESQVRSRIKKPILRLLEIKCQHLFGMVPDDLVVSFKPLRVMSAEQDENVKTQKFNRLLQAKERGEITALEFRDACNRGNLLDIQLDLSEAALTELEDEALERQAAAMGGMEGDGEDEGEGEGEDDTGEERTINEFSEDDHPHDGDGKFGSGGGSTNPGGDKPTKKPAGESDTTKKPMATIDDKGQIKLRKPNTVKEATDLLKQVGGFLDDAMKLTEAGKKDVHADLRFLHAQRQHARAIKLSQSVLSSVQAEQAEKEAPKKNYIEDPHVNEPVDVDANMKWSFRAAHRKRNDTKFKEEDHPRDDDGKFGSGGASGDGSKVKSSKLVTDGDYKKFLEESGTAETFKKIKSENPELYRACDAWCGGGYQYARAVQTGSTLEGVERELADTVLENFAKHFDELPSFEGPLVRDLQLDLDEAAKMFKVGEDFELSAYSSFTARERYASSRRKVRLVVENSTKGKAIWGLSQLPEEVEVVLPKGVKYEITRIEESDDAPYLIVHLKEL